MFDAHRPSQLYSVDQVADRLGLHVRTVRNYVRTGRLKAVRIGKQYRIAREDLEAFTGHPAAVPDPEASRLAQVDVSSVVQIDAISAAEASRVTNTLMAAAAGDRDGDQPLRIEAIYDDERDRLKIIVLGGLAASTELLKLLGVYMEART
jgi:excisionase family DNA binding protein